MNYKEPQKQLKLSATSALVLNWTDYKIWQSPITLDYNAQLDLSEGEHLFKLFSDVQNFMHLQMVTGRKYFIKNKTLDFLQELSKQDKTGQVIILAAGLAPLSVEISALFPTCQVFDIDKYLMDEKKSLVNGNPVNIEFINCDITDVNDLKNKLLNHHFKVDKPTMAIMEGIICYLPKLILKNVFHFLRQNNVVFQGDFCLKPELVNKESRFYEEDVFKKIKETLKLDDIYFYSVEEMTELLNEAGYQKIQVSNMQQNQEKRTGNKYPFLENDSCWDIVICAE